MKFVKLLGSWQFWVNIMLAVAIFFGLLQGIFMWLNDYTKHGVQVEIPNLYKLTLNQAIIKLDENELEYEIDTSKFDPKYKPYQILDVYPLIGLHVKKGRRIFIKANAKTWKPIAVPNVIGKYKYLAFNQLDLVGLKVKDTIYEPSLATNTVLKLLYKGREIQPGVTLPRFSSLTIVLAKSLAKNVSVPSFIGLDEETAKKVISENLFSIGSIIYDDPENKDNARVYYQVPASSYIYDQGQPIDLYLSSKPLDKLRSKIKELDATFNRGKFIDSLDIIPHSSEIHNSAANTAKNTSSSTISINSNAGENVKTTIKEDKPKKLNRVIIE